MAYLAEAFRPLFLHKAPFLTGSFALVSQGLTSFVIARRKRQTLAILQSLPLETLKDIGWKTGN